jgi:hypothetical protein
VLLLLDELRSVGGVKNGGGDSILVPVWGELGFAGDAGAVEVTAPIQLVAVEDVGQALWGEADRVRGRAVRVVLDAGLVPGGWGVGG